MYRYNPDIVHNEEGWSNGDDWVRIPDRRVVSCHVRGASMCVRVRECCVVGSPGVDHKEEKNRSTKINSVTCNEAPRSILAPSSFNLSIADLLDHLYVLHGVISVMTEFTVNRRSSRSSVP
jgi:hypothetical protein